MYFLTTDLCPKASQTPPSSPKGIIIPPPPPSTETGEVTEAESKLKHGVWAPMPELTITSPYVHSPRVDSNTLTMSWAALCQS
jgi:hypothetical protein